MRAIARRLLQLVLVLVLSTLFAFALLRLFPGDIADAVIPTATPKAKQEFRHENGFDRPFLEQYFTWLGNFVTLDLGKDYQSNLPVSEKLQHAAPVSIQLMLYAQVLALLVAIPLGVLTAYRANTLTDRSINTGAFALLALPSFVLALFLAYFVGVKWQPHIPGLGQVPVSGYEPGWLEPLFGVDGGDLGAHFASMLLPTISLAAGLVAVYMRLLRTDMIATLQENFITMARAKGLSNGRILWRHALRPSSLTLLTVAGLNFGTLIGGAVAVEVIFGVPGIGTLIYQAINARQYIELQSYIAIIAVAYVLLNFVIDSLYVVLDPRIRRARA
ncbi:MAG TPA: ABC transporter permease [Acidimicrobiia bacterium]|jgi:peptide/nickel transport system permease protein